MAELKNHDSEKGKNISNSNLKWLEQSICIQDIIGTLKNDEMFEDPFFNTKTLNKVPINTAKDSKFEWLRPKELAKKAVLGIGNVNYSDIIQGNLDDCGLISACGSISKYSFFLNQIFKNDIKLYGKSYRGFIKVKIWLNNNCTEIFIDDKLLTLNGKLYYAKCSDSKSFWPSLIEKAFAKALGGYDKLEGIDSGFALVSLTGGMILRLNPCHLDHREPILHYLNQSKENDLLVAVAGCELDEEDSNYINFNCTPNDSHGNHNKINITRRNGHAYSLIDIFHVSGKNKAFVKMRNSQHKIKLRKENTKDDIRKYFNLQENESTQNDCIYFSYEEFFEYFEILNILVIYKDLLPIGNQLTVYGNWNVENNLINANVDSNSLLIDKYLCSPHYIFDIANKDQSNDQIIVVINLLIENSFENDYFGIIIMPIRTKPASFSFVNYSLEKHSLSNVNPLTQEIQLLPGKYLLGLLIQSDFLPKKFYLRIATYTNTNLIRRMYKKEIINSNQYLILECTKEKIKIILAKCCVCECILDKYYVTSGAKVFCNECYNLAFRCEACNKQVGNEYFTIEQRIYCESCLKKFSKQIEMSDFKKDSKKCNN